MIFYIWFGLTTAASAYIVIQSIKNENCASNKEIKVCIRDDSEFLRFIRGETLINGNSSL